MKIYKKQEFLKLPSGTIYSKGGRIYFDGLYVKEESLKNDWFYKDKIFFAVDNTEDEVTKFESMLNDGISVPIEDSSSRDGRFNDSDIFLVYELDDLLDLKKDIENAIELEKNNAPSI